ILDLVPPALEDPAKRNPLVVLVVDEEDAIGHAKGLYHSRPERFHPGSAGAASGVLQKSADLWRAPQAARRPGAGGERARHDRRETEAIARSEQAARAPSLHRVRARSGGRLVACSALNVKGLRSHYTRTMLGDSWTR